jgi:CheY-like chemotaxis protein
MTDAALAEDLPPTARDCLLTARESADVLLELLNQILDLSRIEAGKLQLESTSFCLHTVVNRTLKPLSARACEKGLDFSCRLAENLPAVVGGDPLRLGQVLSNLVANALKFTRQGKVVIRVKVRKRDRRHVHVRFAVADTGIGISKEDQERIFAPFFQTDASTTRQYGGTGLGLAIVRSLVELMGGRLWVKSHPGSGSTFCFTVRLGLQPSHERDMPAAPRARPSEPAGAGPPSALDRPPTRPLRILLAEDTPSSQKVMLHILTKRGHSVAVAGNGQEAVDMLRQQDFDVVLMDVQMPLMDGLQAAGAIRAMDNPKARLPIVALTAYALRGDDRRCLDAGASCDLAQAREALQALDLCVTQLEECLSPYRKHGVAHPGPA